VTTRISVVVPTLNDATLSNTLYALQRQTRQADEIIVVGRDEAGLHQAFPGVDFVDTGKPVCAAAARNRGIAACSGQLIVFTDSDCIPEPDWLQRHEHAHRAGHQVVGGAVSLTGFNFWAQADNVSMFHDFLAAHGPGERLLLPTLNLSVQRHVIDAVGFMDESFPGAAAEDSDWTVRMRLGGYKLFFESSAVVRHAPSRTRWPDVVRHWRNLGYSAIRVRHRFADEFRTPGLARSPLLMRLLSPLIAARVTLGIYAKPFLWPQLAYLPIVFVTKMIYCFGAAASIEQGYAFDEKRVYPEQRGRPAAPPSAEPLLRRFNGK
jgi:GT2 family glycosyltransferase